LSILYSISIYCQNPTVSISCNSPSCLNPDPTPVLTTYYATITDGQYTTVNGWTRTITWAPTPNGSFVYSSGQNTQTYSIFWNNTPNSPSRKINATIKYTKSGQVDKIVFDEKVVVVKHIAAISSMTITGASPSSPSNGGITSIPCGGGSFTISVPAPTTDPVTTVQYTWPLPSGWAGSSTTNSITVTPDAGTTDGTFGVTAKRSDGTVSRTYFVNYTRPRVTNAIITSVNWTPDDKPLCNAETRQLSGTSTANATVFNWTVTGGTSIVSGANQSIVTVNGTSNGTLTLTATNACQASNSRTWNIFANTPQVAQNNVLVDGHPNYYPNYTNGSSYINIGGGGSCQTYSWQVYGGSGYINPNYGCNCGNVPNFTDCNSGSATTYSSMAIKIQTANRCGQGNDIIIPLQIQGSGGYYRIASSNPTNSTVSVDLVSDLPSSNLKKMTFISDAGTLIVRSHENNGKKSDAKINGKNASFDVANLPRGTYYLVLVFEDNKSFKETIILN
jgi:PKD-like domain